VHDLGDDLLRALRRIEVLNRRLQAPEATGEAAAAADEDLQAHLAGSPPRASAR
jgi:hypothetical protein